MAGTACCAAWPPLRPSMRCCWSAGGGCRCRAAARAGPRRWRWAASRCWPACRCSPPTSLPGMTFCSISTASKGWPAASPPASCRCASSRSGCPATGTPPGCSTATCSCISRLRCGCSACRCRRPTKRLCLPSRWARPCLPGGACAACCATTPPRWRPPASIHCPPTAWWMSTPAALWASIRRFCSCRLWHMVCGASSARKTAQSLCGLCGCRRPSATPA